MRRVVVVLSLAACNSALDQRLSIVKEPRVLAITSEPAEAKPGTMVMYRAVVASPEGPIAAPPAWSLCDAPKPPTEDNAVSEACVAGGVDLGAASTISATIPSDACATFGPDVPGTGFRPRDPDPTGGYYQPVRANADGADVAFGFTRITCNLASAPADIQHEYKTMYVANANPTLGAPSLDPIQPVANSDVALTVSWPASAAESYLYYDLATQSLVTRRESLHISWFATAGSFETDGAAVGESDDATSVTAHWHTPTTSGPIWVWLVLRDSRGGFATQQLQIGVN